MKRVLRILVVVYARIELHVLNVNVVMQQFGWHEVLVTFDIVLKVQNYSSTLIECENVTNYLKIILDHIGRSKRKIRRLQLPVLLTAATKR